MSLPTPTAAAAVVHDRFGDLAALVASSARCGHCGLLGADHDPFDLQCGTARQIADRVAAGWVDPGWFGMRVLPGSRFECGPGPVLRRASGLPSVAPDRARTPWIRVPDGDLRRAAAAGVWHAHPATARPSRQAIDEVVLDAHPGDLDAMLAPESLLVADAAGHPVARLHRGVIRRPLPRTGPLAAGHGAGTTARQAVLARHARTVVAVTRLDRRQLARRWNRADLGRRMLDPGRATASVAEPGLTTLGRIVTTAVRARIRLELIQRDVVATDVSVRLRPAGTGLRASIHDRSAALLVDAAVDALWA